MSCFHPSSKYFIVYLILCLDEAKLSRVCVHVCVFLCVCMCMYAYVCVSYEGNMMSTVFCNQNKNNLEIYMHCIAYIF